MSLITSGKNRKRECIRLDVVRGTKHGVFEYEVSDPQSWLVLIRKAAEEQRTGNRMFKEVEDLLKSRLRVPLSEVEKIAEKYGLTSKTIPLNEIAKKIVEILIANGAVDGVIDESSQSFVSRTALDREKIEYHVTVDFNALHSAAKEKGLIIETVVCPYCGGKLKLPERGNVTKCKSCGNQVYATDVFEKFRGILGLG